MTTAILIISIVTLVSVWWLSSVLRAVFNKLSQALEIVIKELGEDD